MCNFSSCAVVVTLRDVMWNEIKFQQLSFTVKTYWLLKYLLILNPLVIPLINPGGMIYSPPLPPSMCYYSPHPHYSPTLLRVEEGVGASGQRAGVINTHPVHHRIHTLLTHTLITPRAILQPTQWACLWTVGGNQGTWRNQESTHHRACTQLYCKFASFPLAAAWFVPGIQHCSSGPPSLGCSDLTYCNLTVNETPYLVFKKKKKSYFIIIKPMLLC